MRLVGIRDGRRVLVGPLVADGVTPVASVEDFFDDLPRWLPLAEAAAASRPERSLRDAVLEPPIPPSARVLCVGLNYRAHAAEGGFVPPDHPTIFGRWTASLSVGGAGVRVPVDEAGLDWEGEIAAVVGAPLRDASPDEALAAVLGYAVFNDLTARRAQKLTAQWTLGKNADGSGPLGPVVTADEVGDLRDGLRVVTRVNGTVVQDGNSADLIFSVGEVLALVSRTMTLRPGDVLATGTPEGVGYVRTPPWLLGPGDVVEVEVDRLGVLRTPVVGNEPPA